MCNLNTWRRRTDRLLGALANWRTWDDAPRDADCSYGETQEYLQGHNLKHLETAISEAEAIVFELKKLRTRVGGNYKMWTQDMPKLLDKPIIQDDELADSDRLAIAD